MKKTGEIVAVKDLFLKYRRTLRAPQKTVELECVRVVGELFNVRLQESQVEYTVVSRTLFFRTPSLIKQELKFHYPAILRELKHRLGDKSAPKQIL